MAIVEQYFSNVGLLLHFDGTDNTTTFTDSSGAPKFITTTAGRPALDTEAYKFGTASCKFGGLTDTLTTGLVTATNLSTGNFTVELWCRPFVLQQSGVLFSQSTTAAANSYGWRLAFDAASGTFAFSGRTTGNAASFSITGTSAVSALTWYHVAGVRNGNVFSLYVDGVLQGSATLAGTLFTSGNAIYIGGLGELETFNNLSHFNGWLDDIRLTRGVARYTEDFTPPATQFPNSNDGVGYIVSPGIMGAAALLAQSLDTGSISAPPVFGSPALVGARWFPNEDAFHAVGLLLHFDGADASTTFTDSSSFAHTVTTVGNAQVDTAQSKFGGASGLFDGTGDRLTVANHESIDIARSNFTIECWVRLNSLAATTEFLRKFNVSWILSWDQPSGRFAFLFYDSNTGSNVTLTATAVTVSTGTWYHIAAVRLGTSIRLYIDGVLAASATREGQLNFNDTSVLWVGDGLNGWLDDVRITKGVARYTSDFTPPALAFPDQNDMLGFVSGPALLGEPSVYGGVQVGGFIAVGSSLAAAALFGGQTNTGSIASGPVFGAIRAFGAMQHGNLSCGAVLGSPMMAGQHDFINAVAGRTSFYQLDLVTPSGPVRVPISSWQATLQTENKCYAFCVVPQADVWAQALQEATAFIIYRSAILADGSRLEAEIASSPLDTLQVDQGPVNHTASISGYFDPYEANDDPAPRFDRALTGIRSISTYESGVRIRCAIDWTLRPAQRALYAQTSFVVSYMNLYATCNTSTVEEYMDVGERV